MKIETLKQLQQLLTVMRKHGVESIKIDGIEMVLGNLPDEPGVEQTRAQEITTTLFDPGSILVPASVQDRVETETLTEEQLLFYSAGDPQ